MVDKKEVAGLVFEDQDEENQKRIIELEKKMTDAGISEDAQIDQMLKTYMDPKEYAGMVQEAQQPQGREKAANIASVIGGGLQQMGGVAGALDKAVVGTQVAGDKRVKEVEDQRKMIKDYLEAKQKRTDATQAQTNFQTGQDWKEKTYEEKQAFEEEKHKYQQDKDLKDRELKYAEMAAKKAAAEAKKGNALTDGQKAYDKEVGKTMAKWDQGGYASVAKNLKQLDQAIADLDSGKASTGLLYNMVPDDWRAVITPDTYSTQQDVESVVMLTLREILGAQFTQKEGENVLARTFAPGLDSKENARRARLLMAQIQLMADARQEQGGYLRQNKGSMLGYEGTIPDTSMLMDLDLNPPETDNTEVNRKGAKSGRKVAYQQKAGTVLMTDGTKVFHIPEDQVEEAKADRLVEVH